MRGGYYVIAGQAWRARVRCKTHPTRAAFHARVLLCPCAAESSHRV